MLLRHTLYESIPNTETEHTQLIIHWYKKVILKLECIYCV